MLALVILILHVCTVRLSSAVNTQEWVASSELLLPRGGCVPYYGANLIEDLIDHAWGLVLGRIHMRTRRLC